VADSGVDIPTITLGTAEVVVPVAFNITPTKCANAYTIDDASVTDAGSYAGFVEPAFVVFAEDVVNNKWTIKVRDEL